MTAMTIHAPQSSHAPFSRALVVLLATGCLGASAGIAARAEDSRTLGLRLCAVHDLHRITVIEDQGEAQEIVPAILAEASFTVMRARNACSEGRFAEGISLYLSVPFGPASQKTAIAGQPVAE